MEEFCESEVMWPESDQGRLPTCASATQGAYAEEASSTRGARWPSSSGSAAAPVGVPSARRRAREPGSIGEEDDEDDDEMVPPHVLVSRRMASSTGRAAYSLCSGHGRTLKGRDLRHLRDAVLRMTGFLEG